MAPQVIWRVATHRPRPDTVALRVWANRIAHRRGKRIAMVELARKLSGVMYAIMRDGSVYDPAKLSRVQVAKAERAA